MEDWDLDILFNLLVSRFSFVSAYFGCIQLINQPTCNSQMTRSIANNFSNAPCFTYLNSAYAGIASWPIIFRMLMRAYRIRPSAVLMLTRVSCEISLKLISA